MQDLVGAGLTVAIGLAALTTLPFSRWVESWSYDLTFRFQSGTATDEVVTVTMDTESRTALGQTDADGWSRQLHASLLDRLLSRGAQAVVFTTVFAAPSPTNSTDRAFAQALRRARGRVVLAVGWTDGGVLKPIPELASAAPWGLPAVGALNDSILRRLPAQADPPTIASRVVQVSGRAAASTFESRWLNYYGREFAPRNFSYNEALRAADSSGAFKGRIVLVIDEASDGPKVSTPYSHWGGPRATPSAVEATVIQNLLRREWLSRLPTIAESTIVILVGLFLGLAFMGLRRRVAVLLACGAAVLVAGAAFLVFAQVHFWFPWLAVVAAQIPVACGWGQLCEWLDRPRPQRRTPTEIVITPAPVFPEIPITAAPATGTAMGPDSPGIPDHRLLRCIGRGAYGEVWLVRDVIGRHQAVKIVRAGSFADAAPYEREFRGIERFASASRNHPGLVQVLHIGRHDAAGYFFYIMELADDDTGASPLSPESYVPRTLATEIDRHRHVPARDAVRIGLDLCAALKHLHERQLVHRDIKPSNIIFVEGRVKIADIGLVASIASGDDALTRLGTDGYIAPEGPGTPQADLYALGKVLYEISMGRDRRQFPEFPTTLGARTDQDELRRLHEIILTACEDDPTHRYVSASAMHLALARLGVNG